MKKETPEDLDLLIRKMFTLAINRYACENVTLKKINPGEPIPYRDYLRELDLDMLDPMKTFSPDICIGEAINPSNCIEEKEYDYFCHEFYATAIDRFFENAADAYGKKHGRKFNKRFQNLKNDLGIYMDELFFLFREIVQTDVEYNLNDEITECTDRDYFAYVGKLDFFLCDLLTKYSMVNDCVDQYLKNLEVPHYIGRILKSENGHHYLQHNDPESLDFKLAILSALPFMSLKNALLFQQKIVTWQAQSHK